MSFEINDIQKLLADAMFGGDQVLAGMAVFTCIMLVLFAAFAKRNILIPFACMLPMAVMFSTMGIIESSLAIVLALISVIVIAAKAREAL